MNSSVVRRDPKFKLGLIAVILGDLLFNFMHVTSRTGHFFSGLLFGLGLTLLVASLYRSRSTSA